MTLLSQYLTSMSASWWPGVAARRCLPTTPAARDCRHHSAAQRMTPRRRLFLVGEGGGS